MDWNDVRHFLALARTGSVRAAGASLGVSHSTVARRVEALEAQLGTRLFDRHRDGYLLTDAGRQMLPAAEGVQQQMAALERDAAGQDERLAGRVSLTCCDNYVADLVIGGLATLCLEYPEIELGFCTDSRSFDLAKREADLAIRTLPRGGHPPEHLIGSVVAPLTVASYVAAAHAHTLDPARPGVTPDDTRWIAFEDRKPTQLMAAASSHPDLRQWGAFSSYELMVQAAREGLGIVMLPTYVGDREPTLTRLTHPDLRHMADLWLLCHPDLRDNARVRATRDRVRGVLDGHQPLFRGEAPSP